MLQLWTRKVIVGVGLGVFMLVAVSVINSIALFSASLTVGLVGLMPSSLVELDDATAFITALMIGLIWGDRLYDNIIPIWRQ